MKKKRIYNIPVLLSVVIIMSGIQIMTLIRAIAQQPFSSRSPEAGFGYAASLGTIDRAAFYKIILHPGITARCKADLSDLRILGPGGQFVPYVLSSDMQLSSTESFSELPILAPAPGADTSNDVRLANWSSAPIHGLVLFLRNIGNQRSYILSGSDDKQRWFAIKEHIVLLPSAADSAGYYIQRIEFPPSSYHYLRFIQEDKGALPANIIRAGIVTKIFTPGAYQDIPAPVIAQKDSSNHHSYIRLSYDQPYIIDRLVLQISRPELYRRQARVYDLHHPYEGLSVIIDPSNHFFDLGALKTRELVIDITNDDNPPLAIDSMSTSQRQRYLLARLQPGAGYRILAGDSLAAAPVYDLKYFVDSLEKAPVELLPGEVTPIKKASPVLPKSKDHSGILLWSVIVAILALLIVLSIKMLKAIPSSNDERK